jgi:HEAT repeat protein
MTDPTPTLDTLFDQIRHGTDLERRRARIACIDFGEAAVPGLIALLQDDNAAVRHAAINTLGHLKSAAAANALRDRVYNETDIYARGQAIVALAHCAKGAAVPDLLQMLNQYERGRQLWDKSLSDYAAKHLLEMLNDNFLPQFEMWAIAQLERADAREKVMGIIVLHHFETPGAVLALDRASSDEQIVPKDARYSYHFNFRFHNLSRVGDYAKGEDFKRLNAHWDWMLHGKAPDVVTPAMIRLQYSDYNARRKAITDLWHSGDDRCLPLLFEKLNDHEADESGMTIADLARETLQNWVKWRGLQPTPEQAAQLGL